MLSCCGCAGRKQYPAGGWKTQKLQRGCEKNEPVPGRDGVCCEEQRGYLTDLHFLGYHKRCSIPSVTVTQQVISLIVVDHLLRCGIKAQRPAQAVRRVRQVNQRR